MERKKAGIRRREKWKKVRIKDRMLMLGNVKERREGSWRRQMDAIRRGKKTMNGWRTSGRKKRKAVEKKVKEILGGSLGKENNKKKGVQDEGKKEKGESGGKQDR